MYAVASKKTSTMMVSQHEVANGQKGICVVINLKLTGKIATNVMEVFNFLENHSHSQDLANQDISH